MLSASAVAVLRESALVPALRPPFPVGVLPSLSVSVRPLSPGSQAVSDPECEF